MALPFFEVVYQLEGSVGFDTIIFLVIGVVGACVVCWLIGRFAVWLWREWHKGD
jgi:hypothetical protein